MANVTVPDLPLSDYEIPVEEDLSVKDESGGSVVYGFVGVGQGGGRLSEAFFNLGYKKVLAVNTAEHDLNTLSIPENQRVLMDIGEQGAGKNMEKGENAAVRFQQDIYDKMKQVFGTDVNRIIVCAGLGGGTGGGGVLVLLDLARKYLSYISNNDPKKHVGAIVALPTTGEAMSPTVANNAKLQAEKLSLYAAAGEISPLLFVDNDKIQKLYPKLTVSQFWPTVNQTIAGLFHTFNALSSQNSQYTTFDPADYSSVMSAGGCMILGLTNVKNYQTETDVSQALRSNLTKTLLADGFDLSTAKAAACIVIGSENLFNEVPGLMNGIQYGFDTIASTTGNAVVHRGVYSVERENKLTVYTMISGLAPPTERINRLVKALSGQSKLYGG